MSLVPDNPPLAGPVTTGETRSRRRLNPSLAAGSTILLLLVLGSVVVPLVSPYGVGDIDPNAVLAPPSGSHWLGTDQTGFDVATRVAYAPLIDIPLVAAGVGIAACVGIGLGVLAGFSRGITGTVLSRLADLAQAFPTLVLALVLIAFLGNSAWGIVLVLGFVQAPVFLRLVRSRVLLVRELRYIDAAFVLGNSRLRLLARHVLPNALAPAIPQLGISMSYGLLAVAGLAFLGVGVQPPTPEWGSMILSSRSAIATGQWWTFVFPGLGIALAVMAFNLVADGVEQLRELR